MKTAEKDKLPSVAFMEGQEQERKRITSIIFEWYLKHRDVGDGVGKYYDELISQINQEEKNGK